MRARASAPEAITAATSASSASAGASPARTANSRPPMKRAVGTGSPRTSTLASMSALGSSCAFPPTAMMMTQVPVEITVNGSRLDTRCGTSEAFESCAPQMTRTSGARPVAAATSGLRVPSVSQALRIGGKSRRQPSSSTMLERPALIRAPEIGVRADRGELRSPRRRSGAMTNIADSRGTRAQPRTQPGIGAEDRRPAGRD